MGKTNQNEELLGASMSLGDHLEELRVRIIFALLGLGVGVIFGFLLAKKIFRFLESQYVALMPDKPLITLGPIDGFVGYTKIAAISGLIISSPWIFYHLWKFISAGLYPREKRYVYIVVPSCTSLFIAGALFFLLFIGPTTIGFLIKFNQWLGVENNWTFSLYLSFITTLMLIFGITFQTPIVVYILIRVGILPIESVTRYRKLVILGIVIIAAFVTPTPDPWTQLMMSIPLYLLFELGVLLGYLSERKRKKRESEQKT
jgi:sec-independent protein translocase protein TatC